MPGTTRDLLREQIQIDGMPLHLIDTAGLRHSEDAVEQIGIQRAREEIGKADLILWVFDAGAGLAQDRQDLEELPEGIPVTLICNKIDKNAAKYREFSSNNHKLISLSAKTGEGVESLIAHLKETMGYQGEESGEFIARRRHLEALKKAKQHLDSGRRALEQSLSGELLAEDLRQAQMALSAITGEFTADDLLGEIFASFCIGK